MTTEVKTTKLRVELLSTTLSADELVYTAFRQCYSQGTSVMHTGADRSRSERSDYISDKVDSGHVSPIEHVSMSFLIEGVSRALSHQLVRHRIASYSQQSQRYVSAENMCVVCPQSIEDNPVARELFFSCMGSVADAYSGIKKALEDAGSKTAKEDARFVLPNAAETRIIVTMNCRSLLNFFERRCCMRAQWEIRALANEMLRLCRTAGPLSMVFAKAGPQCERLGYCPEGSKFSCGRVPLQEHALR